MRFTQHPSNNRVLGAPEGWDQKALPCTALPVTFARDEAGPCYLSFWQPSEAEKQAIAGGALVQLSIFSGAHPPVAITVEGVPE